MADDEPLEELKRLAAVGGDQINNRDVERQYVELAIGRDYSQGDTASAPDDLYAFLESLGGKLVPHGSQGPPVYSGGETLDSGHFFAHLTGNEECVRSWQKEDGNELYPDSVCHAALAHSLYGTQGFQAFQFPIERRPQIQQLLGKRAELIVYYTW